MTINKTPDVFELSYRFFSLRIKMKGNAACADRYGRGSRTALDGVLVPAQRAAPPIKAEIGTITFPEAGTQLLTFHYNAGNNFASFEFKPVETK
jgi:hypothetical protein